VPTITIPAFSMPLSEAEASHPMMELTLIEGCAAALGMTNDMCAVNKVNGRTLDKIRATRRLGEGGSTRRLSTNSTIEFTVQSASDDSGEIRALKANVQASAGEGSLIANIQAAAKENNILTQRLKTMDTVLEMNINEIHTGSKLIVQTEMRRANSAAPTLLPTGTGAPTGAPTAFPTTFPTKSKSGISVTSTIGLTGVTAEKFSSSIVYSAAFREALAQECRVDRNEVSIVAIDDTFDDTSSRRRLADAVAIESTVWFATEAFAQAGVVSISALGPAFKANYISAFNTAAAADDTGLTLPTISFTVVAQPLLLSLTNAPTMAPSNTPTMAPTTYSERLMYETGFTKNELSTVLFCLFIAILVVILAAVYLFKKHKEHAIAGEKYKSASEGEPVEHGALDTELNGVDDDASMDVVAIDV